MEIIYNKKYNYWNQNQQIALPTLDTDQERTIELEDEEETIQIKANRNKMIDIAKKKHTAHVEYCTDLACL